jgi:hypothetical protein
MHTHLPTFPFRQGLEGIAAQYLAEALATAGEATGFDKTAFASKLPLYLVAAITHVKGAASAATSQAPAQADANV